MTHYKNTALLMYEYTRHGLFCTLQSWLTRYKSTEKNTAKTFITIVHLTSDAKRAATLNFSS